VAQILAESANPRLAELDMLIGIPEYQAPMQGYARLSQTDLLVLARSRMGLCVMAVEGNVTEPMGPKVSEWLEASPGKEQRLQMLCEHLELEDPQRISGLRYRLLHRTVAAMLEAQRYHAKDAVMLVHSFGVNGEGFDDYKEFLSILDVEAARGVMQVVGERNGVQLWVGWLADQTGMRQLPRAQDLAEGVEAVIQSNLSDGYQPDWLQTLTGRWRAPELKQICERLVHADGVTGSPVIMALPEFPLLLSVEDMVAGYGQEWGFSDQTVLMAKYRAGLYDKVSGRYRWR